MQGKRIVVVGAGAIGASVAADLLRAGLDVTLADQWPAHVEAIAAHGLRVTVAGEPATVPARAMHLCELSAAAPFDIAILAVKAYDTRWSAELIRPCLAPDGYVVGLQNALCDEDIAAIVGPSRVVSVVIELSAEIFSAGEVVRNSPPAKTWFGVGIDGARADATASQRVAEVARLLAWSGRVSALDDVTAGKWTKLIANAMLLGPLGVTGLRLGEALGIAGVHAFLASVGAEAIAVAAASGYRVQPVFGLTADELRGTPAEVSHKLVETIVGHIGPAALMAPAQDYRKRRRTEVDAINGHIVRRAVALGLAAPANAAVVEIDRRIRLDGLACTAGNLALATRLAAA